MGYQENFLPAMQKKLGYDVEIITSDRVPNFRGYQNNVGHIIGNRIIGRGKFEENNVDIHRLSSIFEIQNGGLLVLKGLKEKIKELKPDVVHVHGALSLLSLQAIFYSKELNYDVFVDDHTHKNNLNISSAHKKIYFKFAKIFYRKYKKCVCAWMPVTLFARDFLHNELGISDKKMVLLPLGADTNYFRMNVDLRNIGRNEMNLDESDFLIISAGKFDMCKDIHLLITAFISINEKYPHVKLLILGNGPKEYMANLYDLSKALIASNHIFFKGFVPNSDLPKYYNAADVGVWPGDPSITVIEAVATGLPVIVPIMDVAYDILFNNNAAIGFERGNIESLSNAILEIIEKKELHSQISENCKLLAVNALSWEKIAEKSISIYSTWENKC